MTIGGTSINVRNMYPSGEKCGHAFNTKTVMKTAYRIETGITVKNTVRLPVSMVMIQGYNAAIQREEYTAIDLAVYTAQILAFTTLSRVSEYLYTGQSGAYTLMSEDVLFKMQDGTMVPSNEVGTKEFKDISGCIVNIRSAKNVAAGRGHRYFFTECDPATDKSYSGTCNTHAQDHACNSSTYRNSSERSNPHISIRDCRRWQ